MQGNGNVQRIIRSKPNQAYAKPQEQRGKQWERTDKRQPLNSQR